MTRIFGMNRSIPVEGVWSGVRDGEVSGVGMDFEYS